MTLTVTTFKLWQVTRGAEATVAGHSESGAGPNKNYGMKTLLVLRFQLERAGPDGWPVGGPGATRRLVSELDSDPILTLTRSASGGPQAAPSHGTGLNSVLRIKFTANVRSLTRTERQHDTVIRAAAWQGAAQAKFTSLIVRGNIRVIRPATA
jgi:hypothetical protein